jgi:tRNA threonylcarbamoyladenosine biosynthesis protein TsaE
VSQFAVADAQAMDVLGRRLGQALNSDAVVYLSGELGAGKTTLVRGVLQGMGFTGRVRSPTYTLMESYEFRGRLFQHLDLYRIRDVGELEFLGVRELDAPDRWVFIEWPEHGSGNLPAADLELQLELHEQGRLVGLSGRSERGLNLAKVWLTAVTTAPTAGLTVLN